jgi:hypothetical protein
MRTPVRFIDGIFLFKRHARGGSRLIGGVLPGRYPAAIADHNPGLPPGAQISNLIGEAPEPPDGLGGSPLVDAQRG